MGEPLAPFCVYTIRYSQQLDEAYRSGRSGVFEENTTWKTGRQLFLEAKDRGMQNARGLCLSRRGGQAHLLCYVDERGDRRRKCYHEVRVHRSNTHQRRVPVELLKVAKHRSPVVGRFY